MEFLLLVWIDGSEKLDPDTAATLGPDVLAWVKDVDGRGVRVQGSALSPMRDATTIRLRQGELAVTHGTATASSEYIAGFDILQCADLAEAMEVAAKHPVARFGRIELRPCLE